MQSSQVIVHGFKVVSVEHVLSIHFFHYSNHWAIALIFEMILEEIDL